MPRSSDRLTVQEQNHIAENPYLGKESTSSSSSTSPGPRTFIPSQSASPLAPEFYHHRTNDIMPQRLFSRITLTPASTGALPIIFLPEPIPSLPLTSTERLKELRNAGVEILHVPEVSHELRALKKVENREFWIDLVTKREMMGWVGVGYLAFLFAFGLWLNGGQ